VRCNEEGAGAAKLDLAAPRDAQSSLLDASGEVASQIKSRSADIERTSSAAGSDTAESSGLRAAKPIGRGSNARRAEARSNRWLPPGTQFVPRRQTPRQSIMTGPATPQTILTSARPPRPLVRSSRCPPISSGLFRGGSDTANYHLTVPATQDIWSARPPRPLVRSSRCPTISSGAFRGRQCHRRLGGDRRTRPGPIHPGRTIHRCRQPDQESVRLRRAHAIRRRQRHRRRRLGPAAREVQTTL